MRYYAYVMITTCVLVLSLGLQTCQRDLFWKYEIHVNQSFISVFNVHNYNMAEQELFLFK